MREHVSQSKKATTASFSIPSLKHRIPGFGLDSSQASPQAVPLVQPLHKPLTHDISRIPLRNPQAKLSISQPGDKYEQEADSVAQQVMQRIAQPINRQSIQRVALPEGEELQMKPMANSIRPLQRQEMPEDEEELQMKSLDSSTLQRQEVPEDEKELQMKPMVQRQAGMAATPDLQASINQARGGGQAMADNIRHPMEVAFGTDFSGVKVHTDGQSDQLNRSIQARAFTTGQDVFFGQGEYNPGSRGGQELLAHELTHVVQQNGGAVHRQQIQLKSNGSIASTAIKENGATIIQLMEANEIEIGKQYRYRNIQAANVEQQGRLQEIKQAGWYNFDNGKARGANQILNEVEEQYGERSIKEKFQDYLQETNITNQNLINLLVGLNEAEMQLAIESDLIEKYQNNWQEYTSCFDTSDKLFDLLGNSHNFELNTEENFTVENGIPRLVNEINQMNAQNTERIYRIGIERTNSKDHSFVIVIRNQSAEILQSFAGATGEALGENLKTPGRTPIVVIVNRLNNLINNNSKARGQAQEKLFGGRIDVDQVNGKQVERDLRSNDFKMKIQTRPLHNQQDLLRNIKNKIQRNLTIYNDKLNAKAS
ncbi:eCIS core domain-containing protein [Nostoc sp.]|uniref:eCIS core domain-containing protein n=1 Tax=Nostoc sp. TaxID=1180 RepID=UPI002FFC11C5